MKTHDTKAQQGVDVWITYHLPEIYLAVAFLLTFALCMLTPPFFVPDEIAHSSREIQIGHGGLIGRQFPEGVGGLVDVNAKQVMDGFGRIQGEIMQRYPNSSRRPDGRVTEAQLAPFRELRWAHRSVFMPFQNTAVYPPFLYIPQAAGWRIGEAANLTILHTLLLARLFAAMSALAVGWLALRFYAGGRWVLFTYLLLPSELGLSASCSQDALLFAVAGLVAALVSRAIYCRRLFTILELIAVTTLLLVTIEARLPYLPLALFLILPSLSLRDTTWRGLVPASLGILIILGVSSAWAKMVKPLGIFTHPLANPALQIAFLRTHPFNGAWNLLKCTVLLTPLMIPQALEVLGTLDVFPPLPIYALLAAGLTGVALLSPREQLTSWRGRGLLVFTIIAVCVCLTLAEYIIFTPPGGGWVYGLQGRYYLPLVPLPFLLLRPSTRVNEKTRFGLSARWREVLLIVSGLVFLSAVLYTPWVAARGFYNLGLLSALRASALR